MKTKLIAIVFTIFGIFIGIIFTGIVINISAGKMMIKEMKSPYDYEKTIRIVEKRIQSMPEWHVVTTYDMNKEVIENGGKSIGKYTIIKYCSGKYASQMLSSDSRKAMGAMMPKAFAIYEKADGQVYLSTANGAIMGKLFGGETETLIEKVSLEVENILVFMNFKFSIF
ncbi:MAG: hypothetical protein A2X12_03455 [Bacteroidetes bacterium GWE2_29_8]|nr:MAG: hypothetical protein A2X12_03455 [Bacteroidetes bacterium GWE2_29_8]OFY17393.1 MAG: hypothetical protein A2X02_00665 [Bacteroidetes bacterium GWF2_29_10]